jgi:hypothetical protein
MDLNEEAESIERYAEDLQGRIEKYDREEELHIEALQRNLEHPASFDWFQHQRKRRPSFSSSANANPHGSPGHSGNPAAAAADPNLPAVEGNDPASPANGGRPQLKKTDSFKKRLQQSYYLKDKGPALSHPAFFSAAKPSPKHRQGRKASPKGRAAFWGNEGRLASASLESQQSSPQVQTSALPAAPSSAFRSPGTVEAADFEAVAADSPLELRKSVLFTAAEKRSSLSRIFRDGILFSSLDDEEAEAAASATANGLGTADRPPRVMRSGSEDRTDNLEKGAASFFASPSLHHRAASPSGLEDGRTGRRRGSGQRQAQEDALLQQQLHQPGPAQQESGNCIVQ